jgi:hypothetical protein
VLVVLPFFALNQQRYKAGMVRTKIAHYSLEFHFQYVFKLVLLAFKEKKDMPGNIDVI